MPAAFDFERLSSLLSSLPRKQQDLARALRASPEVFAFGTLRALEHTYEVSSLTVIRFAKRLGYEGYADLQTAVREAYFERVGFRWPNEPEVMPVRGNDLVMATKERHLANLDAAYTGVDAGALDAVARAVAGAQRVFMFGAGSAMLVAALGARLLRHVGVRAEVVESAGVDGVIALHDVQPGDVVMGVGLWLQFAELVSVMALAKRLGATTVALVGSQASSVRVNADVVLLAPAQGVAHTFSVVASVAVMELVVARVTSDRLPEAKAIRQRLHDLYVEEGLIAPVAGPKVRPK
jgi:DNA-binding MurR/RpiR family transcriptional regulator